MAAADDPFETTRMSLGEHLEELRKRLFRGVIALVVAFLVGWAFYEEIAVVVLRPMHRTLDMLRAEQVEKYEEALVEHPEWRRSRFFQSDDPEDRELKDEYTVAQRPMVLGFGESFWFALKISMYFAVFFGSPVLLWQMWQFIAAGLYPQERRMVLSLFPVSIALFLGGVLFGYFLMVPYGFYFMSKAFPPEEVYLAPRLSEYLALFSALSLALGIVFQLPVVMYSLVKVDIVEREIFRKYRAHFIVAAFLVGGLLTPPDPFTQTMLAIPIILLYELGLVSTRFIRRQAPAGEVA